MTSLVQKLLKWLPAETAHKLGLAAMQRGWFAPGSAQTRDLKFPVHFLGQNLPSPLGLAAGFDKNGILPVTIWSYGFGWVEVGSVTWRPCKGNPRPRMFRLNDWDIMNRMGLNGIGASAVYENLRKSPAPEESYGVNITKSNYPDVIGDKGIQDILCSYDRLKTCGFYTVLNLSCPNTHDGVTFEDPAMLAELLPKIQELSSPNRPWGVKLGPASTYPDLDKTLAVCERFGCHFYVMGNTMPTDHPKYGKGGRSGRDLRAAAMGRVQFIKHATYKPVVGCGGVFTGSDARLYQKAGADVVQAYNGFVRGPYSGPAFALDVVREWKEISGGAV